MRFLLAVVAAALFAGGAAGAHPLDETGIGHWTDVNVSASGVALRWTLSFSPLAAFVELKIADINGDGALSAQELNDLAHDTFERQAASYVLRVDGQPVPLTLVSARILPENLQLVPQFFQLEMDLRPAVDQALDPRGRTITVDDQSYPSRLSWARITWNVDQDLAAEGFAPSVTSAPLPADLPSPADAMANFAYAGPLAEERSASALIRDGSSSTVSAAAAVGGNSRPANESERMTAFLKQTLSPWVALLALATALALGGLHALSPGHGKTIVAAYLIGTKGRIRDAVTLGAITTFTHVFSVILLGLFALAATRFFVPEKIVPWLTFASGLVVVVIGIQLLTDRIAGREGRGHSHSHGRGHSHSHGLGHSHTHEYSGGHVHLHRAGPPLPARTVPSKPAAAAKLSRKRVAVAGTTDPPGQAARESERPGWRALIGLGISGGIVPCPSALVVLLTAVALNRILFGLALIFAFSLGLAAVLIGLGIAVVTVAKRVRSGSGQPRWQRPLGIFSACAVTVLGLALVVSGLIQAGIVTVHL